MKKWIALMLTALLALGSVASFAESAMTTIESSDGNFSVSFQMPEGATLLSGEWSEDGSLYQANIQGGDNLYFYVAIAAPVKDAEEDEETAPVTYNEENGYTDEYILEMMKELYEDDSDAFDTEVQTTAYGTKLAVVRFKDEEAPSLYVFSVWQDYEIGLTAVSVDADGIPQQITDEQVKKVVEIGRASCRERV